jgi:hypothetical protein
VQGCAAVPSLRGMRTYSRRLLCLVLLFSSTVLAQPHPSVWGESAMTKIRPEAQPGSRAALQLVAARNEFVSFQVGLHGGQAGLTGVSASLTPRAGRATHMAR